MSGDPGGAKATPERGRTDAATLTVLLLVLELPRRLGAHVVVAVPAEAGRALSGIELLLERVRGGVVTDVPRLDAELHRHRSHVDAERREALEGRGGERLPVRPPVVVLGKEDEERADGGVLGEVELLLGVDPELVEELHHGGPRPGQVALREVTAHLLAHLKRADGAIGRDPAPLPLVGDDPREAVEEGELLVELAAAAAHPTDAVAEVADGGGGATTTVVAGTDVVADFCAQVRSLSVLGRSTVMGCRMHLGPIEFGQYA